jgi:hypothetical protein
VEDRSIPIEMTRKLPNETTERFRQRQVRAEAARLRHRAENLAESLVPELKWAEPQLPESWNDRQLDVAKPLLAPADYVGGDWPRMRGFAPRTVRSRGELHDQIAAVDFVVPPGNISVGIDLLENRANVLQEPDFNLLFRRSRVP